MPTTSGTEVATRTIEEHFTSSSDTAVVCRDKKVITVSTTINP